MVKKFNVSAEDLEGLYALNTAKEIASMYKVSERTVRRALQKNGIRKRNVEFKGYEDLIEPLEPEEDIVEEPEPEDFIDEFLGNLKVEVIDSFVNWGISNLRGGRISAMSLAEELENSDINYEEDGTLQLNTEDYMDKSTKKPVVKLRYDPRQKTLEIILRGTYKTFA